MDADLKEWMRHLFSYLEFTSPLMTDQNRETMNSIDAMKAAVCEILYLFIQINEDDFEQYVEQFVATVWKVLNGISLHPAQANSNKPSDTKSYRYLGPLGDFGGQFPHWGSQGTLLADFQAR